MRCAAGVPVDNDIGLFFRSWATAGLGPVRHRPQGHRGHRLERQIHHRRADPPYPASRRQAVPDGRQHRPRRARPRPGGDGEVVVLELSSYQTDLARALTPDIAVFTNLSPDHLDRHGGIGGYFAAKRRLFAEGGPDRAVIGVDEVEGRYLAEPDGRGAGRRPGDPRLVGAESSTGRAGRSSPARASWPSGARGGRWPRSTCAGSPACRAPTTTRTPAPPMRPCARWDWRPS